MTVGYSVALRSQPDPECNPGPRRDNGRKGPDFGHHSAFFACDTSDMP